ncbi:MAG TPA: hypothetical protein VD962_04570 [Rubricoccaceae bacterium]|nr:hypothetical protein [Rubricoccaceae bacterium]
MIRSFLVAPLALATVYFVGAPALQKAPPPKPEPPVVEQPLLDGRRPLPLPGYLTQSLRYLAEAQFENGGWGAGSHARQDVRDPHAVQTDPATTAFAATALLRAGSTHREGPYARNVRRALEHLLDLVEDTPANADRLTSLEGTQPQVKLGRNIDASMTAQFFTAVLPHTRNDRALRRRIERALDRCLGMIQRTQAADGSWNDGGWAPVLQSSMANTALERAAEAGRPVDRDVLARSRAYQGGNVSAEPGAAPSVDASAGAGVALYSATSAQRATAPEARRALEAVREAQERGDLDEDDGVTAENLGRIGFDREEAEALADAYEQNRASTAVLADDAVWTGFGNNGGEEFLSYLQTSESLVIGGDEDAWARWHARLSNQFGSIQNGDGSWSGHHCITSPVFCTAAVILALAADRDPALS